ncbi:hypothetical protein E2562_018313 [Oryza meyeriana var. granulata]|uniref:Uncharacterized protein n=1 Tax=Oryza meyeriana var. granulata TaxID=110450 RepID=A0A6G1CQD9_9ORYZ|nr:hypothetical protein E2562_018313 [Oryza meyeriana var. granulata]
MALGRRGADTDGEAEAVAMLGGHQSDDGGVAGCSSSDGRSGSTSGQVGLGMAATVGCRMGGAAA